MRARVDGNKFVIKLWMRGTASASRAGLQLPEPGGGIYRSAL